MHADLGSYPLGISTQKCYIGTRSDPGSMCVAIDCDMIDQVARWAGVRPVGTWVSLRGE